MQTEEVLLDMFLPSKIGLIVDTACEALEKDGAPKDGVLKAVAAALHEYAASNGADYVLAQILRDWAEGSESSDETFSMLIDYITWEPAKKQAERGA